MNFEESAHYLLSLGNEVLAMKLGLENIRKLLRSLENPEKKYFKIQIAGTNGKGSTCAFLEAICVSAGIHVGLTTSPHLISVTERIRINGREISEKDFARYATKVREKSEALIESGELETVPTYFEQVTAIALLAFSEAEVDLAILETGLGGRFDATTATNAEIVAITPIDYDHQNILGNSLAEIAAEKAAIIRKDTTVFVTPQKNEAAAVIDEKCRKVGVIPIQTSPDVTSIEELDSAFLKITFKTPEATYQVTLSIRGKHQWTNADLAIRIAQSLENFNFKISKANIEAGLEAARHKGRLEFHRGILFDGAHNIAGAKALRAYLDEFVSQPLTMIFGAMRDKDLSEIAETLFPKARNLILTVPDNPRSMELAGLMEYISDTHDKEHIFQTEMVGEALSIARKVSGEKDLILVTGSLYLVGEAQKILKNENGS